MNFALLTKLFKKKPLNESVEVEHIMHKKEFLHHFYVSPEMPMTSKYEISIGGAAGLGPYLLGIGKVIQDNFKQELKESVIIGTSAGGLLAYLLASNIQIDGYYKKMSESVTSEMKKKYLGSSIKVIGIFRDFLHRDLKNNCDLVSLVGKLYINTTCYDTRDTFLINYWNTHGHLADSLAASSLIPGLHTSTTILIHGRHLYDGGFITCCPYVFPHLKKVKIHIHAWRKFPLTKYLPTSSIEKWDALYELGISDANEHLDEIKDWFHKDTQDSIKSEL